MIAELPVFKAHVAATRNRAVFEVVEALDRIVHSKSHSLL
jgi:hypothetical protein